MMICQLQNDLASSYYEWCKVRTWC